MATLTTTISYGEPAGSMVATLGAPGPAGQAATVTVGSTSTGDPGTDAIVVNSGTSSAAVLDFTIPRGDAGAQGPQGVPGTPGAPGAAATVAAGTTTTGAPGSSSSVVNVGTSSAAVFDFTIPRGDVGAQGPQGVPGTPGAPGAAATVAAGTTTTGAPGSSSSVVNVGTSSAAVFDFTIPRGDVGAQGPKGDQGDPGQPGVVYAVAPLSYDQPTQTLSIDLAGYATESWVQSQGYLTSGSLSGYATESWVTSQGYLTSGSLSGYATESWVQSQGYLTSASLSDYALLAGAAFTGRVEISSSDTSFSPFNIAPYLSTPSSLFSGDVWFDHNQGRMAYYYAGVGVRYVSNTTDLASYYPASNPSGFINSSALTPYLTTASAAATYRPLSNTTFGNVIIQAGNQGVVTVNANPAQGETTRADFDVRGIVVRDSTTLVPVGRFMSTEVLIPPVGITFSDNTVQTSAGVSLSVLNNYALLSGASFTGKINCTSVSGAAGINVGIGGTSTSATAPGDLWITTGGANLNFRDGTGAWKVLAALSNGNVFTAFQAISATSTNPALRVTQLGTGNALLVEDSTTPDTSALVVDQSGNVGIGVATGYTSTAKLEVVGNAKADTFSNGAGPTFAVVQTSAHTGGTDTLDLIITVAGVNYRVGLRPA